MSGKVTRIGDFDADADEETATIPTLPGADVGQVRVLLEQDDETSTWRDALELDRDDVECGEREGVFYVDQELAILSKVRDRDEWHGWCECSDPSPCAHLCALAQLHAVDDLLPEVDLA